MTSKTFKNRVSVRDAESVLEITDTPAGIRITVREEDRIVSGWFNPVQGAGISLALLEAAGYSDEYEGGNCWAGPLGQAMHMLRLEAEAQERATTEARERAELEAEALELVNAWRAEGGEKLLERWDAEEGNMIKSKPFWLAVARRARELAKEATK